ncbi:MAG: hypothetical protein Q9194_000175 [Teloschistes cf. exilis]
MFFFAQNNIPGLSARLLTSPISARQGFFFSPYAPNLFRSYGVENIEKRYSAGGGSANHLPAGGTPLGSPDKVAPHRQEEHKGMGSPHYQEKIGGQKPEGSQFDKAWNKAQYGSEKGK